MLYAFPMGGAAHQMRLAQVPHGEKRDMAPEVKYANTSDGVAIAYYEMGDGTPIVAMPNGPLTDLKSELEASPGRTARERTASRSHLIRYDSRGFGLSESLTRG
jgi:hypothetical protein